MAADRASMSERYLTLTPRKKIENAAHALSPQIDKIISEYSQAQALDGLMAIYQRLREVCGPDTTLQVNCVDGESHLHVTTFNTCGDCD